MTVFANVVLSEFSKIGSMIVTRYIDTPPSPRILNALYPKGQYDFKP